MHFAFNHKTYLAAFLLALMIVLVITPWIIRLAVRIGFLDRPDTRKKHSHATPLMGGIAVFLGMWIPLLLLVFWDNDVTRRLSENWGDMFGIFAAGSSMLVMGLIDDKYGIGAKAKFTVQLVVAGILVASGMYFKLLSIPFYGPVSLGVFGPILTLLWIVGVTNAFNLIDGIDGLATGVAFFVALVSAVIAIVGGSDLMALSMCALGGASLGFLRYNYHPARIFLGDAGSLFIGMVLATASVATSYKATVAVSMAIPCIMLGYPILDTLLAMAHRKLVGKPIFSPDNGHIHHRLLGKGFSQGRATLYLYGFCVLFCVVALLTVLQNTLIAGVIAGAVLLIAAAGCCFLGYVDKASIEKIKMERPAYRLAYLSVEMAKVKVETAESIEALIKVLRDECEYLEMQTLKMIYFNKEYQPVREEILPLMRKRSGVCVRPVEREGTIEKKLSYAFKALPMAAEVTYYPASISADLQNDLSRLLIELFVKADHRIRNTQFDLRRKQVSYQRVGLSVQAKMP